MAEDFDSLWDYSDPAASEARFREARDRSRRAGDGAEREISTQLARSLGLQGRFDEGHAELDALGAAAGEESVVGVRALLERGRLHRSSGDPGSSIPLFEAAFELARRLGLEFHAIDAAHMLGIAHPERALEWNHRAIDLSEAATDERARGWRAALLNNTAWLHHERGEPERALELFEAALELRRAAGKEPARQIAEWSVARCLRTLGRVEEALGRQWALLAELGEEPADRQRGFIAEEIGECLWALDRCDEARPHLAEAAERLVDEGIEPERLAELRRRGEPDGR